MRRMWMGRKRSTCKRAFCAILSLLLLAALSPAALWGDVYPEDAEAEDAYIEDVSAEDADTEDVFAEAAGASEVLAEDVDATEDALATEEAPAGEVRAEDAGTAGIFAENAPAEDTVVVLHGNEILTTSATGQGSDPMHTKVVFQLAPDAAGPITFTPDPHNNAITIIGNGADNPPNDVAFNIARGINVTIRDVFLKT
ncbi:MAG: hypothetical protein LBL63_06200, partial [Clostridiales Family XIII bacterium]|nr:hypothetical protein [Clostridiales Family XIII bacterium]